MIICFLPYLSIDPGLLEIQTQKLASVTSNFCLVLTQFQRIAAQSEISSKHDTTCLFLLINFNIFTRTYCLNETTFILSVAFLLSVSI